jgi:hypothetical protein
VTSFHSTKTSEKLLVTVRFMRLFNTATHVTLNSKYDEKLDNVLNCERTHGQGRLFLTLSIEAIHPYANRKRALKLKRSFVIKNNVCIFPQVQFKLFVFTGDDKQTHRWNTITDFIKAHSDCARRRPAKIPLSAVQIMHDDARRRAQC